MSDIPEVLLGVLKEDDYIESLKALRNRLAYEMSGDYCEHCNREGPKDAKDISALAMRLESILGKIEAASRGETPPSTEAPSKGPGTVTSIQARSRAARQARTGAGTQSTDAPTSVAKRQGPSRRPGAGRKAGS